MKVGISSACFYPYINTEDTLKIIKDSGANLCEVFLESDFEMEEGYLRGLEKRAEKLQIKVYSVHPFSVCFEPFLFDRYERRRLEMEKRFRKVCRAAQILGAECYVFHGIRKTMPFPNIEDTSAGMDRLVRIASEYGVKLAWENVAWCMSSSPEFIKRVSNKMKEEIYFTLDIKQAIRGGHDPLEYLEVYGDRTINVHINDASSESTCLLPGKGTVDLKTIAKRVQDVNSEIPFIIEVYSENFKNPEELGNARNYIQLLR